MTQHSLHFWTDLVAETCATALSPSRALWDSWVVERGAGGGQTLAAHGEWTQTLSCDL